MSKLKGWGIQVQSICLLCGQEDKTIWHLFFNCSYTRFFLIKVTELLNQLIWKISNTSPELKLGDITETCQKNDTTPLHGACTGSLEQVRGTLWHICSEKNRRPPESVLFEIIRDSSLSFRSDIFKKSCDSQMEETSMQVWKANLLRQVGNKHT